MLWFGTPVAFPKGDNTNIRQELRMSHGEEHPLTPILAATEVQLQSALDEVCEEIVIEDTATNELIRIEETLAVATEAAKTAISLRRRITADGDGTPPVS